MFSHLYVSLLVYEQVLGLQVSVDQVQSVQVLKGQDYLGGVKPGVRLTVTTRTDVKEGWGRSAQPAPWPIGPKKTKQKNPRYRLMKSKPALT